MEPNMWTELIKSSPAMVAVIVVVFAFLRSQRDITNDFKEVVKEIHEDMKVLHSASTNTNNTLMVRLEQAAQGSVQNSISTNTNTTEIQKLSVEVRRLADNLSRPAHP